MGPLIPLFGTSGDICPGFQSQDGLACMLSCLHATLRFTSGATPADLLTASMAAEPLLTHVLAAVRRIHKHWWRQGQSHGSNLWPGPGLFSFIIILSQYAYMLITLMLYFLDINIFSVIFNFSKTFTFINFQKLIADEVIEIQFNLNQVQSI